MKYNKNFYRSKRWYKERTQQLGLSSQKNPNF
jgi:hypothetical protein